MNINVFWFDSGLKYKTIFRRSGNSCSVLTHSDGTSILNLQVVSSYGANGAETPSWANVNDGSISSADDPATTLATEDANPRLETVVVPSLESENASATVRLASVSAEIRSLFIMKNMSV